MLFSYRPKIYRCVDRDYCHANGCRIKCVCVCVLARGQSAMCTSDRTFRLILCIKYYTQRICFESSWICFLLVERVSTHSQSLHPTCLFLLPTLPLFDQKQNRKKMFVDVKLITEHYRKFSYMLQFGAVPRLVFCIAFKQKCS